MVATAYSYDDEYFSEVSAAASAAFVEDVRPAWMDRPGVLCRGVTAIFYPDKSTSAVLRAKGICNGKSAPPCRHREACLHYAIDHAELYGCWGGTSERDRRKIRRARKLNGSHIYSFEQVRFPGVMRVRRRRVIFVKVRMQRQVAQ